MYGWDTYAVAAKVTAQTNVPFQVKLHIRLYSGLFKYKIPTKIL